MWPFGGPLVRVPRSLAASKQSASRYVLGCPITLCNLRASAADAGRACTWCLISIVALHTVCGKPFGMQRCRGSRALAYFADPKKNEDYDEEDASPFCLCWKLKCSFPSFPVPGSTPPAWKRH